MDDIDLTAMRLLARQGRMTWAELAQHLKLSSPAAAERVRRLEEKGIVKGYGAVLDRPALGHGLTAFVGVELGDASRRSDFYARVNRLPEVLECHYVTGDYDYLLKVACRDATHLDELLSTELGNGTAVARTRTMIVLGTAKEALFSPPLVGAPATV